MCTFKNKSPYSNNTLTNYALFRFALIATSMLLSSNYCLAEKLSIQLLSTKLRSAPKQFASSLADLKFGDSVDLTSKEGSWFRVTTIDGKTGYIHESAVTLKQIVLSSRQVTLADIAVDESQVYLAGKGFNAGVEQSYAKQESEINYAAIDQMTKTSQVPLEQSLIFIKEGKLTEAEL